MRSADKLEGRFLRETRGQRSGAGNPPKIPAGVAANMEGLRATIGKTMPDTFACSPAPLVGRRVCTRLRRIRS